MALFLSGNCAQAQAYEQQIMLTMSKIRFIAN